MDAPGRPDTSRDPCGAIGEWRMDKPDGIDPLQAAILAIMASCDRRLTLEEIAAELRLTPE